MRIRLFRLVCFVVALLPAFAPLTAASQSSTGTVAGSIVDRIDGLPIPSATIELFRGDALVSSAKTDSFGRYAIASVTPGAYRIAIVASGYQTSESLDFVVTPGAQAAISLAASRASNGDPAGNLKTIGAVSVSSANALASTTTITSTLDPALVAKENYIGLGLALARVPGVNSTGLSSSVSDDQYLNIRGLGPSETQTLLDGHPVGPQGVYATNGGGSYPYGFNFSDSPIFGLQQVTVTFGAGATGLYGVDAIGGTIDLQTLNPTRRQTQNFSQSVGDQGQLQTAFNATGTAGKFSYATAGGVLGTYGMFAPGTVAQTGRPNNDANLNHGGACTAGNDISPCNTALNTYDVSQNSTLRAGLAKLGYKFSDNTKLTATVYSSGQQSDSTGNGDNDNIPYDTRLAQIESTPGNCTLPGGAAGTKSGYAVITVANAANTPNACYRASQWANASYGPYGGGADRNRGAMLSDYDFNLQSVSGKNTLIADGYFNHYKFYKSSEEASGLDAAGTAYSGTQYSQFLNSEGYLLADDIRDAKSDFGFGYFGEYQLGTRLDYNVVGQGLYNYETPESTHYNSGFLRASYQATDKLSAFGNFWIKSDSTIGDVNFDPRVSLVLRPETHDVVRATFGHSTGDPAAELKASGPPSINANPSSLNPSCTPYNSIGSGGNPDIKPENANDYEIGYAHRFARDSSISVNLYYTSVRDQLFAANEPLSQYGNVAISPTLLQGFADKIASQCPGVSASNPASVLPFLAISTTYNAASAVSKGIELSGRERLTRHVYFDYSYDLQSVVQTGVDSDILMNNPYIVNGGQQQGIPINQGTAGIDYTNAGTEVRLDGYVVGSNNPSNRPGYNTWNGFVSQTLGHGVTLTFGVQNVFDEASQNYGYFGHEPLVPENNYFNDSTSIGQYLTTGSNEEFGLRTRSFLVTLGTRM